MEAMAVRNVAVRTGIESGLVVIDIDPQHGGSGTIRSLIANHSPLERGPVVRTGAGGWHLLFAHPGEAIRNSAGTRLGAGIDVRGDGGYVIAPPVVTRAATCIAGTLRPSTSPDCRVGSSECCELQNEDDRPRYANPSASTKRSPLGLASRSTAKPIACELRQTARGTAH